MSDAAGSARTAGGQDPLADGTALAPAAPSAVWERHDSPFRLIWEHTPSGMRLTDENGTIVLVNEAFCEEMRRTRDEMEGRPLTVVYAPHEEHRVLDGYRARFAERDFAPWFETQIVLWSGEAPWFECTTAFVELQPGRPLLLSTFRNVTHRKQAEEALRDSQALHHSLVETLPLSTFRKDLEGRFTFGNTRFAQGLGRPIDEILGRTDHDFFPRELAEKYRADDRRALETGEVLEDVEEHRRPDGRTMYVQVLKTRVTNARGEPVGIQGCFWDISERKAAEQALALERDLLRTLIDNIPDYIYFKDCQSRFILNNIAHIRALASPPRRRWPGRRTSTSSRASSPSSTSPTSRRSSPRGRRS